MPCAVFKGYRGTDYPDVNPQIRSIVCPFTGEQLTAVPAHRPDVAIVHAQRADRRGNVWMTGILGVQKEAVLAAATSVVTVEEVVDSVDERSGGTVIPHWAVDVVCEAPLGAFPSYAEGYYDRSNAFYQRWGEISRDYDRFREWMERYVLASDDFVHLLSRLKEDGYV